MTEKTVENTVSHEAGVEMGYALLARGNNILKNPDVDEELAYELREQGRMMIEEFDEHKDKSKTEEPVFISQ